MNRVIIVVIYLLLCTNLFAQYTKIYTEQFQTLRIDNNEGLPQFPIIKLNSTDKLFFSFDYLTHEYNRFTYKIEHCTYDWKTTSELFESEYLISARNEEVIEDYQESFNTSLQYTHYKFQIPNKDTRLLLSGNYKLTLYVENEDSEPEIVAETYFYVVDPKVNIQSKVSGNTDIDWNKNHQQLDLEISTKGLQIRDANEEIKVYVLQNNRWDTAVRLPHPTTTTNDKIIWEHCRSLIFGAGNEYRKFEILSTRYPGLRVEKIRWFSPYYHVALYTDSPRRHYIYDEEQNGISVIRSENGNNPEVEAEYVYIHYSLEGDYLPNHTIYVNGNWNMEGFIPRYKMKYNFDTGIYEASILQKMGYYNYQYLAVENSMPTIGSSNPFEGNFFQTENEYTILVYYNKKGERYNQLVGFQNFSYLPK